MEKGLQLVPSWYWIKGLHDAIIEKKECIQEPIELGGKYYNNCLRIYINGKYAMFDTSVKIINLYNYKVIGRNSDISGFWWIEDTLNYLNNKYELVIKVGNRYETQTLSIRFTYCEVIRE